MDQYYATALCRGFGHSRDGDGRCIWCGDPNPIVYCWDCRKLIAANDDALVCIDCGGRNRRIENA